ncbi:MAG: lipid II flippase MurJ [Ilumatobacteraceae bacterium]
MTEALTTTASELTPSGFRRDTLTVTVCTLIARVSGFGRVMAVAAVMGNGVLADVYLTANMIPNLLFELVALGVLQAVLVPSFVAARREGGDAALSAAARATSGVIVGVLSLVALIGLATAPLVARLLVASEPSAAVASEKLDVMVPMVLVFVPQIIFYGVVTVLSAALHAKGRFIAAALAPAVNNVIVIVACVLFRANRDGRVADLELTAWQFALIAGGTTIGVLLFSLTPAFALRRAGVQWWPQWRPKHPAVVSMKRSFRWATLSIVGTLVPTAAALVIGNGAAGGVAVFVYAFAFFVLPHALIAVTIATTLVPRVADAWQSERHDEVRAAIDGAVRLAVPLLVLAGAGMAALSWPVTRLLAGVGQAASQGFGPIAHTLAAFGPGLIGYGIAFVMIRVLFALDDVRRSSLLMISGALTGVGVMALAAHLMAADERAPALAIGYGASQLVAAVLLTRRVNALTGAMAFARLARVLLESLLAGFAAYGVMLMVVALFEPTRLKAVPAVLLGGMSGVVVFAAVIAAFHRQAVLDRWRRVRSAGDAAT